jgi:hypothetical protein
MMETLVTLKKQASIMRRPTVLSLALHLVFPAARFNDKPGWSSGCGTSEATKTRSHPRRIRKSLI